jgi:hypothetical protein
LRICGILKCIEYFFKSDYLLGLLINGFPYNSIGSFTEFL